MNYRRFGRTEIQVSAVSLGGAYLMGDGSVDPVENARSVLDCAFSLGINYIDTAPLYGESEIVLGRALDGNQDKVMVSTKVGFDPTDFDYRADSVLRSLDRSIGRLGVERIFSAQIHEVNLAGWERIMEPSGTLEGLRIAQERGLCTHIGITGRAIPLLAQLAATDEFDTMLFYHDYHPCRRLATRNLLPIAAAKDIGIVVATVLAGGLYVADEYREEAFKQLSVDEKKKADKIIERLRLEEGTLPQTAFRYVLGDGRISSVSSGAADPNQLREVASAVTMGPLSDSCLAVINDL